LLNSNFGTATNAAYSFVGDTDVGIYRSAANVLGFTAGGSVATATTTAWAFPSTLTAGLQLYNTVDQVTNYERLALKFGGNIAQIGTDTGTTATGRQVRVYAQTNNNAAFFGVLDVQGNAIPFLRQGFYTSATGTTRASFGSPAGNWNVFADVLSVHTSGTNAAFAITPTYNQASGTAANTDLKIERTETAVGSGVQYLIQAGTAALGNQFTVNNRGGVAVSYQSLSGAGAVNVTNYSTEYTSTGGAQALTLADGLPGQIKVIVHGVDGGSGVLTPTTKTGFTTITFTNAGDAVTLQFFTTRGWVIVGIFGAVAA
jgi:hypothetical protein